MKSILPFPLLILLLTSCEPRVEPLQAERGFIDLSKYDLSIPINLDGEWEFYWDMLLEPADFSGLQVPGPEYVPVPLQWSSYQVNGEPIPRAGNATYRLRVKTDGTKELGLHLRRVSTAYRLYVDGNLVLERGRVEKDYRRTQGQLDVKTVYFHLDRSEFEIILQVSNAFYTSSGIPDSIILGTQESVQGAKEIALGKDLFSIGFILFAGLIFLFLFLLRRKEKDALYFALFCFIIAFRTALINGERVFYDFFPLTDLVWIERLQSITVYTLFPIFISFIAARFTEGIKKPALRFYQFSGLAFLVVMFFIHPRHSETVLLVYYPILISGLLYVFFIIHLTLYRVKTDALPDTIGVYIIIGATFFDILADRDILHTDYILNWGLLIFISFQSFILFRRFVLALKQQETLTSHLNAVRNSLADQVTERTKDLIEARFKAENESKAKSIFLTNMSHEMRTPLNGIIGNTELMLETDAGRDQSIRDYGTKVINESQYLLFLINQLLDISEIESGKMKLEQQPFSPAEVLSSVEEILKPLMYKKEIAYKTVIAEDVPDNLMGDYFRLRQILINIAGNSIKFTNAGFVSVEVKVTGHDDDLVFLRILVSDTGIGMSEELQQRVFDMFVQGDTGANRMFGGTGLGTTISRQLVELMGGSIDVSSKEGVGTSFIIDIPFEKYTPSAKAAYKEDTPQRKIDLLGRHILLVEDYPATRQIVSEHLERAQALVTTAEDGRQALEAWQHGIFDLVLMDIQLPGIDGYELTRRIRSTPGGKSIPIIAVTANALSDVQSSCKEAGITNILSKPITRNNLIGMIAGYLGIPAQPETTPVSSEETRFPDDDIDHAALEEIKQMFLRQAFEQITRMEKALEEADYILLHRDAHSMKGGALELQLQELATLAGSIEKAARDKNREEVRNSLPELSRLLTALQNQQ